MEDVTEIGDYAFRDCTALALTALPEGLTEIMASMHLKAAPR